MKRSKLFASGVTVVMLVVGGCSGDRLIVSAPDEVPQDAVLGIPFPPGTEGGGLSKAATAGVIVEGNVTTYTFNDLGNSCNWDYVLNNTYHDLEFMDTPYFAPCVLFCNDELSTALLPARRNAGATLIRIKLPSPAISVSISAYKTRFETSNLIAYDASGAQLAVVSAQSKLSCDELLTIIAPEGTTIDHIGLQSSQTSVYWDNLKVTYEPPSDPAPAPNTAPVADAGVDQTLECAGFALTPVALDGSGTSDTEGDTLSYSWSMNGVEVATGEFAEVALPLGTHTVTLAVDDGRGGSAVDSVVITVEDTTPPEISLTVVEETLWSPNKKMRLVVSGISATDACCDNVVLEVSVTSTGGKLKRGKSKRGHKKDWLIIDNGDGSYNVSVRAKRHGKGKRDRIYTVAIVATDCSGNTAVETVEIVVPHDKRHKKKRHGEQ